MTPEPEVWTNPAEVEVHAKASVEVPAITELSKRVDQTHDLVLSLDTRFETHRQAMDVKVGEIATGVAQIRTIQAEQAGRRTESEKREDRHHRRKANLIAVASALATVASTVAMGLTLLH